MGFHSTPLKVGPQGSSMEIFKISRLVAMAKVARIAAANFRKGHETSRKCLLSALYFNVLHIFISFCLLQLGVLNQGQAIAPQKQPHFTQLIPASNPKEQWKLVSHDPWPQFLFDKQAFLSTIICISFQTLNLNVHRFP